MKRYYSTYCGSQGTQRVNPTTSLRKNSKIQVTKYSDTDYYSR